MKHNPEFVLYSVAGKQVLAPTGRLAADLNGMITLNDMGVFVWKALDEETTFEQLLSKIMSKYEVDRETAEKDLNKFLDTLRSFRAILE